MSKRWEIYHDIVPEPDIEKKEQTRQKVLCEMQQCRMSDAQFICGQIRFIKPYSWFAQFLFWFVAGLEMCHLHSEGMQEYRLFSMISMVTPVLFVFQIEQFSKIYQRSMLEIALTTRFSLKKVLLARLLIFGMVDLAVLTGWILVLHVGTQSDLWRVGLYSLVPFNLMVAGLFLLLRFERSGYYNYIAISYVAALAGVFHILSKWQSGIIYDAANQMWWLVALVLTVISGIWSVKMLIQCSIEKGTYYEGKLGTNNEMLWR